MKHLILFFFMMTASSVFAESFKCSEGSETALQENRLQYSVFINQVNEIKNPDIIKDNDRAAYVLVSVLSRNPKVGGPFKLNRPTFGAVAVMADVMFFITDKKHGFQFNLYMDELNETSMSIKDGWKNIRMNCTRIHDQNS